MTEFEVIERKNATKVVLAPVLDIRAAQPLMEAMQKAVGRGCPLSVDAAPVERLSTACIQILIAAEAAMKSADGRFTLSQPSSVFTDAFQRLGLEPVLAQWNIEQ